VAFRLVLPKLTNPRHRAFFKQPLHELATVMDSMRSLNTSLPGTSPPKSQAGEPPEQLLSAFKAAALSVTKLYKTAALDQTRARSEGYQDAIDDLLAFLDKENLGVGDGEGWKIRRWATERYEGSRDSMTGAESDDELDKAERASSPVLQRAQSNPHGQSPTASPSRPEATTIIEEEEPIVTEVPAPQNIPDPVQLLPPSGNFTFRSSHAYPQDADMDLAELNLSDNRGQVSHDGTTTSHTVSRSSRQNQRHNAHSRRSDTRSSGSIGRGAGSKRKVNIADFFDISNLGHGKDGFGGGGKRGRFA
jgi:hypothetical protein